MIKIIEIKVNFKKKINSIYIIQNIFLKLLQCKLKYY